MICRFVIYAAICLCIAPTVALAQTTAKDTPFGSELVPPNYPDSSPDETFAAIAAIAEVGGHVSFVWHWNNPDSFDGWAQLVPIARHYGLKVFFQMGTIFLNNPAAPIGVPNSFGDPETRWRFLLDVQRVAQTQPDYLVLTTEANFLYRFNRPEFEHFRELYVMAYQLAKSISPNTKVGVSHHYSLWFVQRYFEEVDVPAMISPTDFEAFTTYPEDLIDAGVYGSLEEIPAEWHGLARVHYPDRPILFSEIGWSSKAPHSSPESQAEFLRQLPRLMSIAKPELITWALFADVAFFQRSLLTEETTAFLEALGVDIDRLFLRFNGLGLIDMTGVAKPALAEAAAMAFEEPDEP
jgi:hypothetical protein